MELEPNRLRREPGQPIDIEAPAALIPEPSGRGGDPLVLRSENRPLGPRRGRHGSATAGCLSGARKAYEWLADRPLSDGSWYNTYLDGE